MLMPPMLLLPMLRATSRLLPHDGTHLLCACFCAFKLTLINRWLRKPHVHTKNTHTQTHTDTHSRTHSQRHTYPYLIKQLPSTASDTPIHSFDDNLRHASRAYVTCHTTSASSSCGAVTHVTPRARHHHVGLHVHHSYLKQEPPPPPHTPHSSTVAPEAGVCVCVCVCVSVCACMRVYACTAPDAGTPSQPTQELLSPLHTPHTSKF